MRELTKSVVEGILARGHLEGMRASFRLGMEFKFGNLSPSVAAKLENASLDELAVWIDRFVTSESADDVVG